MKVESSPAFIVDALTLEVPPSAVVSPQLVSGDIRIEPVPVASERVDATMGVRSTSRMLITPRVWRAAPTPSLRDRADEVLMPGVHL